MGTNYRRAVLTHWANLTGVGVAGVLGAAAFGPVGLFAVGVAEALALWIVPDIPSVQKRLDATEKDDTLETRRWYYLNALWRVQRPVSTNPFFAQRPVRWAEVEGRRYNTEDDNQFTTFIRLVQIVEGLYSLRTIRPDAVTVAQIGRIDDTINGWLARLYTAKNITDTLAQMDRSVLADELARLEKMYATIDPKDTSSQVVLGERLRALQAKADLIPALEKKRGLVLAEADTIVQQIETLNAQARTSGLAEGAGLLDTATVEGITGYDEVTAAAEVRGILSNTDPADPKVWENLRKAVGTTPDTPPARRLRRMTTA